MTETKVGHYTRVPQHLGADTSAERRIHDAVESRASVDSLSAVCLTLAALGRRRNYVIRRQFLIERPSEQQFKAELNHALGEHELTPKQLYERAANLRKFMLKHFDDWAAEMSFDGVRSILATCNGKDVSAIDLNIMANFAVFMRIEQNTLEQLQHERKTVEKEIEQAAKELPVSEWWCSHRGLNLGGLGKIVAETGDLNNYANPDKVKKRMGLAPHNGKAYSTWRRTGGLTKEEWIDAGYNPRRRSVMFQISDPVIKNGGTYREVYDARKLKECENAVSRGLEVVTTAKVTADNWDAAGLPRPVVVKKQGENQIGCGHINNRARRYMEQRILIDLWAHWTGNVRE